ncbi:MAG: hypothetical protein AAF500_17755 [Myxococcota bacterium]
MLRLITISGMALFLWSCDPSQGDAEAQPQGCVMDEASDGQVERAVEPPPHRTLGQDTKNAARWVKERTFRHLSVDTDAYPQRPFPVRT